LRTYTAHTSIWRETHIHTLFSICLPNLRDYYHAEAEDAKKMIYEQLAKKAFLIMKMTYCNREKYFGRKRDTKKSLTIL
jgi:hypothetical protein